MRLLIVVVNYRTPDLTLECLRSLAQDTWVHDHAHVVLVENGSGDDSGRRFRECIGQWPWVTLAVSDRNLGFSGGNNLGLAEGERVCCTSSEVVPDCVLLLNSDTRVSVGCLARCLELMDLEGDIGAMSCRVLNADGSIQNVARRFPTPLRTVVATAGLPWRYPRLFGWANIDDMHWDRQTTRRDAGWLGGAFLLIRRRSLAGIVRLDEDFFFYGEDIEICHRIWSAGYRCHYAPVGDTVHLGGASSDPSRMPSSDRSIHQWRARYLLQRKLYGRWAQWLVRAADVLVTGTRLLKASVVSRRDSEKLRILRQQWHTVSRPVL